jgi:hypothetical protein
MTDPSLHFFYSHYFSRDFGKSSTLLISSSGKTFYKRFISQENLFTFKVGAFRLIHPSLLNVLFLRLGLTDFTFTNIASSILSMPIMSGIINIKAPTDAKIKYSRSLGSNSILLRKLPNLGYSAVRLSSGVRKVVSIIALCEVPFLLKQRLPNKKLPSAKALYKFGKAPRSRGVAKNPIDHPHGGRTKSIKYPRTP